MKIVSKKDLECEYSILKWLEENKSKVDDREKVEKEIIKIKKAIRQYTNKPIDEERMIKSDFDSCIVLIPLPERLKSIETATEYFEEFELMTCRPSQYDCTGQLFTAWYKVFKRNNRFYAYHCICMDV